MAKCFLSEKVKYEREDAERAAEKYGQKSGRDLRIYCCEFCGMWHLTHHKRKDW